MRLKTPKELVFADLRKHLNEGKIAFKLLHEPSPMIIHMDMAKIEERVLAEVTKPIRVAMIAHDSSMGKQAVLEAVLLMCDKLMVVEDTPPIIEIKNHLGDIPAIDIKDITQDYPASKSCTGTRTYIGIDLGSGKDFSAKATYKNGRMTSIKQIHKKNFGRRGQR